MSTYEKYYVPEQSRFPIYAATSLFILVMGAASTINALGQPDSMAKYNFMLGWHLLVLPYSFGFEKLFKNI